MLRSLEDSEKTLIHFEGVYFEAIVATPLRTSTFYTRIPRFASQLHFQSQIPVDVHSS